LQIAVASTQGTTQTTIHHDHVYNPLPGSYSLPTIYEPRTHSRITTMATMTNKVGACLATVLLLLIGFFDTVGIRQADFYPQLQKRTINNASNSPQQ
jgi:hypothetical protein